MSDELEYFGEKRFREIKEHGFTDEHMVWFAADQIVNGVKILLTGFLSTDPHERWFPYNWDDEWYLPLCEKPYKERVSIARELLDLEYRRLTYLENQDQ